MRESKGIPIFNVYYMLAYAFEFVDDALLERAGSEDFANQQELLAALLDAGIGRQLKRGLYREYASVQEGLMGVRGRISMPETMRNRFTRRQEIECSFDELSENNRFNSILKTTAMLLLKSSEVQTKTKDALKKKLLFFGQISAIEPYSIDWGSLRFDRNNRSYRFLLSICQLVITGMLMKDCEGNDMLAPVIKEEQMHRIYERFILKYYERHWRELRPAAPQIPWAVDDDCTTMLPVMQTDITLRTPDSILIIDAKYYSQTLQYQERWNSTSIHSGNLYQIFTYVKNAAAHDPSRNVSGMLLYARTDSTLQPDERYKLQGNEVFVSTLDLSCKFEQVASRLDSIANLIKGTNDA